MGEAIVVKGLGKRFVREGADRPSSFKEALLRGMLRVKPERFWGLRDVSFSVPRGRTVGVVGKNGAGKSTLLRLIGGVGRPDEGSVEVHGRIGALLDLGAGLSNDLTGRENVYIAGVISGMTRAQVHARFDEIVAFAELEQFIDSPIRIYSTGMRMRLAFAVAAHIDPEVLLIDEVLAVGDLAFQRKCLERIARFKAEGCTIFLVSHDSSQIRSLCDEVILLRDGRMLAYGATDELLDQYERSMEAQSRSLTADDVPGVQLANGSQLQINVNRFGSQELQITDVRLLSLLGAPASVLVGGAGLVVEFDYRAAKPIPAPNASISILQPNGQTCYDTNTAVGSLEMPTLEGEGTLRLRIERLDLAGGDYFVDVGLYEREWSYTYDYHAQVYPLQVIAPTTTKGVMAPPSRWELQMAPAESQLAEVRP